MMSVALRYGGTRGALVACVVALTLGSAAGAASAADVATDASTSAAPIASEPFADTEDVRDRRAMLGPAAGALTALVPLTVGGALLAHDDQPGSQRAGAYIVLAGFAAAPWVAHGIEGRWRRALFFGLASLATSAGTVAAMNVLDPYDPNLANYRRLPFTTLFTTAFLVSAIGVIDSFVVAPEPRRR